MLCSFQRLEGDVCLQKFCKLSKDVKVEPKLVAGFPWLPLPPFPQAALVLGHHQHNAVIADSKVVQFADARDMFQPLHDGNLLEGSHLYRAW